jgi:hypothetical protein
VRIFGQILIGLGIVFIVVGLADFVFEVISVDCGLVELLVERGCRVRVLRNI